jgi:hypothetical protein
MTRHKDDEVGALASLRLLIIFSVAGIASASTVGLVSIIDTWWILAFAVLFFLLAGGVALAAIAKEMDRDEASKPG